MLSRNGITFLANQLLGKFSLIGFKIQPYIRSQKAIHTGYIEKAIARYMNLLLYSLSFRKIANNKRDTPSLDNLLYFNSSKKNFRPFNILFIVVFLFYTCLYDIVYVISPSLSFQEFPQVAP